MASYFSHGVLSFRAAKRCICKICWKNQVGGVSLILDLVKLCFLVTPINQFLIILVRCTLYTPVCLQDEPTCMRIEPV